MKSTPCTLIQTAAHELAPEPPTVLAPANSSDPREPEPHSPPSKECGAEPDGFQGRLVALCDGRPGLRGSIAADVREPADAGGLPIIDFVSSDETLDRYEEIISADGWKLETYRRNPVFQNAHQYGNIIFTLGKALETEVREGKLYQRVQFATEVNPMARIAYGLYRGRFLNAVSVGFIPLRWENGKDAAPAGEKGTHFRRKYLEQELLEVSAVSIPANPNALQLAVKAGAVQRGDLTDLLDLLHQTLVPGTSLPAKDQVSAPSRGFHELLSLARQIKRLIRHT